MGAFFGGMLVIALIDKLVPEDVNPHEMIHHPDAELDNLGAAKAGERDYSGLGRTGTFTAIAIAIHNIPEGISVAVPIYYATGDKKKAFTHSFLSGLAEPLGALLGFTMLRPFFSPALMGVLFALVAGIMVFISLDELLPSAEEYGEHHLSIYGLIAGMVIMAVSLELLG